MAFQMLESLSEEVLKHGVFPMLSLDELATLSETSHRMHRMVIDSAYLVVRERKLPTKMGYLATTREDHRVYEVYQIQHFRFLVRARKERCKTVQVELKLMNHVWDESLNSRSGQGCRPESSFPGPTEVSVKILTRNASDGVSVFFERAYNSGSITVCGATVEEWMDPGRSGEHDSSFAMKVALCCIQKCGERLAHFGDNYPSPGYLQHKMTSDPRLITDSNVRDRKMVLERKCRLAESFNEWNKLLEWKYRPAKTVDEWLRHVPDDINGKVVEIGLDAFPWSNVSYWNGGVPYDLPAYHRNAIWGNTFVIHGHVGMASFHFVSPEEGAYMSLEHPSLYEPHFVPEIHLLPSRVRFRNIAMQDHTFCGDILWTEEYDTSFRGSDEAHFELTFDSELLCSLVPFEGGGGGNGNVILFINAALWDRVQADIELEVDGDRNTRLERVVDRLLGRLEREGAAEFVRAVVEYVARLPTNPIDYSYGL